MKAKKKVSQAKLDSMTKRLRKAREIILDIMKECEKLNPEFESNEDREGTFAGSLSAANVYIRDALWHDGKVTEDMIMQKGPSDEDDIEDWPEE